MTRLLVAVTAIVCTTGAFAQANFPSRPITMIVGFAPGGGTDITARIIAKKLADALGVQVVVDNRAGAGGSIAVEVTAKATPDGYTICLANVGSLTVAPHTIANLPYDPRRDLAPITGAVSFANVLVVHPSLAANSVGDYVKLARAKPGTIGYGTSGIDSTGHLAGELLRSMAKVDIVHVPYKGGGPAMTDLLGGQIPSAFASAPSAVPHIKSGKIRALAVTSPQRSPFLLEVPTIAESGYPGYDATNWYAYVAPAKTPPPVIERLNREIVAILRDPGVREQLAQNGMEPMPTTPGELAQHIEREYAVWGRVVKDAGIHAE